MATGKRSSKRPLQEVLGQGANVNAANPLEVHDPKVVSLISYEGVTTADGAADGSTLIDTVLTAKPDLNGNLVIITSGAYAGQARDINGVTTGGTVTPHLALGGQILHGTSFVIAAIRLTPAEVAALAAALAAHEASQLISRGEVTSIETKVDDLDADLIAHEVALAAHEAAQAISRAALGTHDTDIKALLATIAGYIDDEIAAIITSQSRQLFSLDFWSAGAEEVQIAQLAGTDAFPDIIVANLPDGATVVRATLMFKFRYIENEFGGANNLDGATVAETSQVIQIQSATTPAYVDGINFVDNFFNFTAAAREYGDIIIGTENVAATVDGNDTYNVQWLLAKADQDFINFNDLQVGLRIWFSV